MKKQNFLLIAFLFIATQFLFAQSQVTLQEKGVLLPTYPVAPAEKSPVFFTGEAYQGASRHYYPLKMNDQYINKRVEQEWKHLVLGNEYIELAIAPEIGGKIYYATDKTNGYNFVYKNSVVKPSNIGMMGAWVSGGIEWCMLHHHRPSTYLPVDYTTTDNGDGSKTVWVGESEPRHGMRWTMAITLFPGKSYFKAEGRIFNASPVTHSFLYWANVAAHTNENYQAIFPPGAQVVTYHSKTDFTRWPVSKDNYRGADFSEGVDISWWKNVKTSNSFFVYDLQEDFMGGYDHGRNSGTVHIGDHNIVKGAKLWEWGSGPRGQATESRLTDNDGPYVEIMVGAFADNQPDYSWIRPYEVKKWEHYWFPVKGIGGFKNANLNGAVNLEEREGNSVFLGYYSTGKVERAKVILKNKDKIVLEQFIDISPEKPYAETIKIDGPYQMSDLFTELTDVGRNETLVNYQPVDLDEVDELPKPWNGYPAPDKLETVEELYLTGKRVEQFYAPLYDELDWYMEALKRDPDDIRTNTAVGNHYLKNGDYKNARVYLSRAIKRLTKDYTRPSTCEALYLQGLTLKALGLYKEAIDTLYRATWDYAYHSAAYYQLAQISVLQGDLSRALNQVNESLATNIRNNRAVALKASLLRRMGKFEDAEKTLEYFFVADQLDFRIRNEQLLIAKESGNLQKAEDFLSEIKMDMRDFDENYLELAVGYIDDGLFDEGKDVLERFQGSNPLVNYYLGYIGDRKGNKEEAMMHFKAAAEKPVDYIFPYRMKTVEVLNTALKYNNTDGKAHFYIGNILYEKQPVTAIESWEKAIINNPDLAMAFRNLGWGYYQHYENLKNAIANYEKAISLNKNEAIFFKELDELYEMTNTAVETRLMLFEGNNEIVKKRDDAFIRQIEVLTLAGQPDKALEYLKGMDFAYREGSSRIRDIIIDAQLMAGKKYFQEKDFEKALQYFLEARVPQEEAGSVRSGNRDCQVNFFIGMAYDIIGNNDEAKAFYKIAAGENSAKNVDVMDYYRGLAFQRLGDNANAQKIFNSMIEEANRQLNLSETSEAGVIFGAREAENIRQSRYLTIRGLGNKGMTNMKQAIEDLEKAMKISHSNLWSKVELDEIINN